MSAGIHLWKNSGTVLGVPLLLFMFTTFFRARLDTILGPSLCNLLFFTSIGCVILVLLFIAWHRNEHPKHELDSVAMAVWFIFWVALSRDARRYDFFIGPSIAFFTTDLIRLGVSAVSESFFSKFWLASYAKRKPAQFLIDNFGRRMPQSLLKAGIASLMLAAVMFWTPAGEHAKRSLHAATQMRRAMPGDTPAAKAFEWMKAELPHTAVVAANWEFGSQLNVLGGVKTVIDQDHYIQHWIHLYNTHVREATDARDALEFLKTHGATHLMLTQKQPPEVFLQGELRDAFVPVYPTDNFTEANVKVWQLHYPPEIQPNPKYLATEPGE